MTGDATCESDPLWFQVKKKLYVFLRVARQQRLDIARAASVAEGVGTEDLDRCPYGSLSISLFLHVVLSWSQTLRMQDVSRELLSEVLKAPWSHLLAARWPVFEILSNLSLVLGPKEDACTQLWVHVPDLVKAQLGAGTSLAAVALLQSLEELPEELCPLATATATLALHKATSQPELLQLAQKQAGENWPTNFVQSAWPALQLLWNMESQMVSGWILQHLTLQGTVVYINFFPEDISRSRIIEKSIDTLQKYWFEHSRWPITVFTDSASSRNQELRLRRQFPQLEFQVALINESDLQWPMSPHQCSTGYRRAARFTAGPLWMHQALGNFSHVMLIDTEFELTHPVPWDPLQRIFEEQVQLGYWQAHYEGSWNRTMYLTEVSRQFMQERNLIPKIPELVSYWWDETEVPGGSLPVNIYGCLFAGSMSFFRSELYQSYFQELDRWPGFDEHCWSPQSILAIAAAFFLSHNTVAEIWVFGRHQNSSKTPDGGWNDS
ncbi:unnamed protein product [Durusdinium trenchii]|uniref:Uncharacterized protein n=1 Tax=Durusdinium trenchii TaxID=1381693 RepID=A0ABP0Q441_9DINO